MLTVECAQHYFNCPFQLGMGSDDTPRDADYYVLEDIAAGDVIIAATDGVWDNVYEEDMVRLIAKHKSPKLVAEALGSLSQTHGQDGGYMSPFAANAMRQGLRYLGGKLDDVTVVVARVGALNGPGDFLSPVSSSEEADKKCSE